MHWQYQWCENGDGASFGPFDSATMIAWREAGVFVAHPARVRRCDAAGNALLGEEWRPAATEGFQPKVVNSGGAAAAVKISAEAVGERKTIAAARDGGALAKLWWELSRPRKRGKIAQVPGHHVKPDSMKLIQQWLAARQMDNVLEQENDQQGFQVFRFTENSLNFEQQKWDIAFHGTRWYALWNILHSGVMLASDDKDAGHDFWEPGVYCTPVLSTARWYGIPHIMFGDDIYHRVVMELRVNPAARKRSRERGGVQWVFPAEATVIRAIWVQSNAPPDADERRFVFWDPDLEARPPGKDMPPTIFSPRRVFTNEDHSHYEETKMKIISSVRNPPKPFGGLNAARLGLGASLGVSARPAPPPNPSPPAQLSEDLIQTLLNGPLNGVSTNGVSAGQQAVQNTPPAIQSAVPAIGLDSAFQDIAQAIKDKSDEQKRNAFASVGLPVAQGAPGSLSALLTGGAPADTQPQAPPPGSLQALLATANADLQAAAAATVGGLQDPAQIGTARPALALPENGHDAKRQKISAFATAMANIHKNRGK